ncbi:helicase-related protein [Methylocystis parvus]|uniref:Helicase n=1 Tax=Methylocystis parvus TaxID=134 RepID=A0A6B8M5F1_9HYPH|nr:helicase-related protein [Methylocystis parvus]QGM96999.1 helicase [Methylocystis parvus]WBJ99106.1 helicase [Methylocystis parvus OBBP]
MPPLPPGSRAAAHGVAAVLGPTNTGKTHHAIERMLSFPTGLIGLPLRLLAREVYNRVVARVGSEAVALVTGEEKIKPRAPAYWISTVEAMPRDIDVDFLAIDEVQLAADLDRGHIFTDRLLRWRGRHETLLIGAGTMEPMIRALFPGAPIFDRPRLSRLTFAGDKKISRLPPKTAVVAFSAEEVYAIAEWIKRQRGGAAVVLGALSPRTRNAQVELFQSGDVDYIVATDAIGMGLNLDVDHVAFASDRKFDGWRYRRLTPAEFGQIAGRAGRHMNDGAFGATGRCPPFEEELIEQLEDHRFNPVELLQWRNSDLDFSSVAGLMSSLEKTPGHPRFTRAPIAVDQLTLEAVSRDEIAQRNAKAPADVARLWEACQIPDYRKTSPAAHADLALAVFGFIARRGKIPADWMARHIDAVDRVDGDIDTLSNRLAQVRTVSFIANRSGWLDDAEHWQSVARRVEDSLSDALHARLTQRFVDRRTSVLMRRLRENAMLEAEINAAGDVLVEGQHVGSLQGFRFTPDPGAAGEAAKALNAAAQKALAGEFEARATRVFDAVDDAFVLGNDGVIRWLGEPVGKITAGAGALTPAARVLADEQLTGAALEKVQNRLDLWLAQHVKKLLGPLETLEKGEGLEGVTRGVAFQIAEELGVLDRARVAKEIKSFSQDDRGALRKLGVRFGAYHIYLPQLLKPAPRALASLLWALQHGGLDNVKGLEEVPHLAASGRTSFAADQSIHKGFYRAAGFRVCGERVVRVDILERLADLIRPAIAYKPGATAGDPPAGAADGEGFVVTVAMTSLTGCSGEAFSSILKSLGYASTQRPGPAITVPLIPAASMEPIAPKPAEEVEAPAAEAAPESAPEPAPVEAAEESAAIAQTPGDSPAPVEAAPAAAAIPVEAAEVEAAQIDPARADAAQVEAAQVEAKPEEAAAEPPATIEVWAPQRHSHAAGPRRHGPPQQRGPRDGAGDAERRGPRRDRPRAAEGGPAPDGASPQAGRPQDKPRFDKPRFDKPRFERGGPRDDRGRGRPGGGFGGGEKRERQPDPDSPFAKLAALKAELEKKGKS